MRKFLHFFGILLCINFTLLQSTKSNCPNFDGNNNEWIDLEPFGCYHLGTHETQKDAAAEYCKELTSGILSGVGVEISDLAEIRSQEVQFMLTGIFIARNLTKEAWWIGASKVIPSRNYFSSGNTDLEYPTLSMYPLGKWKILLGQNQ